RMKSGEAKVSRKDSGCFSDRSVYPSPPSWAPSGLEHHGRFQVVIGSHKHDDDSMEKACLPSRVERTDALPGHSSPFSYTKGILKPILP
ncbi:MAG: hypothetical protein WCX48_11870, partial [Bacteroidales bacterium]